MFHQKVFKHQSIYLKLTASSESYLYDVLMILLTWKGEKLARDIIPYHADILNVIIHLKY